MLFLLGLAFVSKVQNYEVSKLNLAVLILSSKHSWKAMSDRGITVTRQITCYLCQSWVGANQRKIERNLTSWTSLALAQLHFVVPLFSLKYKLSIFSISGHVDKCPREVGM